MKKLKIFLLFLVCHDLFAMPSYEASADKLTWFESARNSFSEKISSLNLISSEDLKEPRLQIVLGKTDDQKPEFILAWNELIENEKPKFKFKPFPKTKKMKYQFDNEKVKYEDFDKFWKFGKEIYILRKNFSVKDAFFQKMLTAKKVKIQIIGETVDSKIFEFNLKDFQEMWEKHKNEF